MKIANKNLLTTSSQSLPWTSIAIFVGQEFGYSVSLNYLTSSATIKLQCSNDPVSANADNQAINVSNWTDITDSIQSLTSDGDITYDVSDVSYQWVRVVFTGVGSVTSARINLKGV